MPLKFSAVKDNYETDGDTFKAARGGNINDKSMEDTCAMRMSYALTKAGLPISIPSDYYDKDGNKYIIKVKTMFTFLSDQLGEPATVDSKSEVEGKTGIIMFYVTSHVDLWDDDGPVGHDGAGGCYWTKHDKKVYFWELTD